MTDNIFTIDGNKVSLDELVIIYKDYKNLRERTSKVMGKREGEKPLNHTKLN